jgi:chaperonin cofactor prefoldin
MPIKECKEYAKTAEELETLADGIGIHYTETDFPAALKEQDVRSLKKSLEDDREVYEKAQAHADKKHEVYEARLKVCKVKIADAQRTLQGFHGLRSQILKDYGFQPPKMSGKKGKRTPKAK